MNRTFQHRPRLPRWVVTEPELLEALENFADTFDESAVANEIASQLTCSEAEAFAGLLAATGALGAARLWLCSHADGDRPDYDSHYGIDELSVEVPPPKWMSGGVWNGTGAARHQPCAPGLLVKLVRAVSSTRHRR